MKILILTFVLMFAMATIISAQDSATLTLRPGLHKKAGGTGLKVKFISVVEDSRCPKDVNCIQAGNAKIKIQISDWRGSKTAIINTTSGPTGDNYGGFTVNLTELTPLPLSAKKTNLARYRATFEVQRLTR